MIEQSLFGAAVGVSVLVVALLLRRGGHWLIHRLDKTPPGETPAH
jgi:hypothetical protein